MPDEEKLNHKAPSEKQREQKIAPRRLETIFRTNMRVSYASGRYKHMLEMARRKAETYPPGLKEQFTADLDEADRANQERLEKLKAKNTTREEEKEE